MTVRRDGPGLGRHTARYENFVLVVRGRDVVSLESRVMLATQNSELRTEAHTSLHRDIKGSALG